MMHQDDDEWSSFTRDAKRIPLLALIEYRSPILCKVCSQNRRKTQKTGHEREKKRARDGRRVKRPMVLHHHPSTHEYIEYNGDPTSLCVCFHENYTEDDDPFVHEEA